HHSQALGGWVKNGIRDSILINFDAHDDMRWIAPEKIAELKKIHSAEDWQTFRKADSIKEQGLYDVGSFIHAARNLGVVSKVYWVIPFPYLRSSNPKEAMNAFLKKYGFSQKDIDTFTLERARYEGTCCGTPVVICDIESLPDIKEPVLLSIDADFFPSYSAMHGKDMLSSITLLHEKLAQKKYAVRDATVSCSVDGGYLDVARRWIVRVCERLLVQPDALTEPYPDKWLVYNQADTYFYENKARELNGLVRRFEKKYNEDIPLRIYAAFWLIANGKEQEAFSTAEKIAGRDSRYAYLLADLGQCLIDRGRLSAAVRFFDKAYRLKPEMNFRQKNLADAFFQAGEYEKAVYYYNIYRRKNGLFPAAFHLGLSERRMNHEEKAGLWFKKGLQSVKNGKYTDIRGETDREAIKESVEYFTEKGMHQEAAFIMRHPSFKKFFLNEITAGRYTGIR
ncbi:MAG: tetratricopeptide repeat protein, partial [Candidatus Omnitrophica bacterium]|nr:tetratricopeptide repeat protein [Candidatus Omnitrophota bacterium]